MNHLNRKWGRRARVVLLATAATTTIALVGGRAHAQQAPGQAPTSTPAASHASGPPPAPIAQLGEVIVTAQKRSENLQKTPLAITAVSSQDLRAEHITHANDLTYVLPDVFVNSGGSTGDNGGAQAVFTIRGLGSSGTNPEGSPAVAVHEDGHYFHSGLADNEFFDLQRIEVSPGPQGTLYGRSASAGAINIITNKPVDRFEGEAELEGGNYGDFRGYGMVNIPINDTLYVRIAGQYQQHNGYLSNGYDDLNSGALRTQVLWKPDNKLSIRFAAQYFENSGLGSSPIQIDPAATALGLPSNPYDRSVAQYTYNEGSKVRSNGYIYDTKVDFLGELTYNFGPAILTVSPTYEKFYNTIDNGPIGNPYSTFGTRGPASQDGLEFRFNDPGNDSRLKWVIGGNYFDYSLRANVNEHIVPNPFGTGSAGPFNGVVVADAFDHISLSYQSSYAVFAQTTYSLLDRLRLTAGVRENWDSAVYHGYLGTTGLTIGASPNLYAATPMITPQLFSNVSFRHATWKIALDYDLTPRSLLYGTIGTGYKPGGLNEGGPASSNVTPTPLAPSQVYQPETVTHYEIGSKNRFFNNRLQINDALYYDDYKNYQNANTQVVNPLAIGALGSIETNAGVAHVYGNELSAEFLATPADRINASLNYLDAYFVTYLIPAFLGSGGGVVPAQNDSGYNLPSAPRWSGTASYSHRADLPGGATLTGLVATYLTSSYWAYYQENPGTHQGAYTKTTMDLSYETSGHDMTVTLYVKNLEDRATLIAGGYLQPFTFVYLDAPRTYGITVSKHF